MADCTPPVAPGSAEDSKQRIDDEHRQLNALLVDLEASRDLDRIERQLARLRELLVVHFATEEAPDGLHEIVSQHAAHRLPNVQQLFREHREIVHRLDALWREAAALRAGPFVRLVAEIEALAAALRAHEAVEDEIFGEAFYTDVGGRA